MGFEVFVRSQIDRKQLTVSPLRYEGRHHHRRAGIEVAYFMSP